MSSSRCNSHEENTAVSCEKYNSGFRLKTAWPYVAAILSLVAGAVLAIVAYAQISSGDDIGKYVGCWNAFVTLAYIWLSVRLILRHEGAYKMGLDLSRTNIWFVFGQMQFWRIASEVTGMSLDEEVLITGLAFIVTDIALYVGVLMTRRDLILPLRAEEVPELTSLLGDLERADTLSHAERKQFLDLRRRFIAHMSRVSSGGVEINGLHNQRVADLVARPALFPARTGKDSMNDDRDSARKRRLNWGTRTYSFQSVVSPEHVEFGREAIDYVVAISGSDEALEAARKSKKVGLYLIRRGVYAGKRSSAFEKFVQHEYGIAFSSRR